MVLKRQGRDRDGGKRGRDSEKEREIAKKFKEERVGEIQRRQEGRQMERIDRTMR